jgi:DNA polymerase I-like protein with 3'-5' exonuclease and polymerase domains
MRILAILSNDENLLNAFKNNEDIHLKTAKFIFP